MFIGVWGILVSELQVPSSIVFGDVMNTLEKNDEIEH